MPRNALRKLYCTLPQEQRLRLMNQRTNARTGGGLTPSAADVSERFCCMLLTAACSTARAAR